MVETRNITKLPTMHSKAPITKNYLTQNAKSSEVEEPCVNLTNSQLSSYSCLRKKEKDQVRMNRSR